MDPWGQQQTARKNVISFQTLSMDALKVNIVLEEGAIMVR